MSRSQRFFAFLPLVLTIGCLTVGIYYFFFRGAATPATDGQTQASQQIAQTETAVVTQESSESETKVAETPVSVQTVAGNQPYSMDAVGTVKSGNQVKIFPQLSGEIVAVNVEEGDTVKKGDVLFVLGGLNGSDHLVQKQYEIANANYETALKAYNTTSVAADSALKSAQLQLQSAEHQNAATYNDYNSFAENMGAATDGIGYIRVSLGETELKNQRDIHDLADGIDELNDGLHDLRDAKKESMLDFDEQIDNASDDATKDQLIAARDAAEAEFSKQIDDLTAQRDKLDSQHEGAQSGAVLAENQIQSQLEQAQTQLDTLATNRDSLQMKLGLYDGSSDPLKLAQQGVQTAKAQTSASLLQAKNGVTLAQINLELATDQQENLLVRAPMNGTIGNMTAQEGAGASPQSALADIVNQNNYELEVHIDTASADALDLSKHAQVKIGKRFVDTTIKSVSPLSEAGSQLVKVTLILPKIALRPNQTLTVRLPLMAVSAADEDTKIVTLPLDAVIIGTEEQFVYIVENGLAKRVTVELGDIHGDRVEIVKGLSSSDKVVVEGARDLLDGQSVKVQ